MLQITNIDIQDAKYNTCAPFQPCDMKLGSVKLTYSDFLSIRIYCNEDVVLPVCLAKISCNADSTNCTLTFNSNANKAVGTCTLYPNAEQEYTSTLILSESNQLVGHLTYAQSLPVRLIQAVRLNGGAITTNKFKLLPQCHVAWLQGISKSINVDGTSITSSVTIKADRYMRAEATTDTEVENSESFQYSVVGPYGKEKDGICQLYIPNPKSVNGIQGLSNYTAWIGSGSVVIRHALTSNARVITEGNGLVLKGVTDG